MHVLRFTPILAHASAIHPLFHIFQPFIFFFLPFPSFIVVYNEWTILQLEQEKWQNISALLIAPACLIRSNVVIMNTYACTYPSCNWVTLTCCILSSYMYLDPLKSQVHPTQRHVFLAIKCQIVENVCTQCFVINLVNFFTFDFDEAMTSSSTVWTKVRGEDEDDDVLGGWILCWKISASVNIKSLLIHHPNQVTYKICSFW